MLVSKIIGLILLLIGFLILKFFPDIGEYQRGEFTLAGIIIGIVMVLVGIGLLIFG